jgi:YihY family inner membrane protein
MIAENMARRERRQTMSISLQNTQREKSPPDLFLRMFKHTRDFLNKFNNDWAMQSASGLAYNLMGASVPIIIAIISAFSFTVGRLDPVAQNQLIEHIKAVLPSSASSTGIVELALNSLKRYAGLLGIVALLTSIFGGSRLFISIEGYFDIIYRTYTRKVIPQNIMAIFMMFIFIIFTPLMVFTSSIPALILSLVQSTAIEQIPGVAQILNNGLFLGIASILSSVIIAWLLFEAIYLFIPNQKISFSKSWPGALFAAILLELFLTLFPLYITHFMGSYTGTAGFVIILLVFYYYFAVIMLLGAEINAYFGEHIPPLPKNLAAVIHDAIVHAGQPNQSGTSTEVPAQADPIALTDQNDQHETTAEIPA